LPIFGEKLAFFSKTNGMVTFLQNWPLLEQKTANIFAQFFGENIVKFITSVLLVLNVVKRNAFQMQNAEFCRLVVHARQIECIHYGESCPMGAVCQD
jgi:hypothetical protein